MVEIAQAVAGRRQPDLQGHPGLSGRDAAHGFSYDDRKAKIEMPPWPRSATRSRHSRPLGHRDVSMVGGRRHRIVLLRDPIRASTTSFNAALMPSWTPITAASSTRTATGSISRRMGKRLFHPDFGDEPRQIRQGDRATPASRRSPIDSGLPFIYGRDRRGIRQMFGRARCDFRPQRARSRSTTSCAWCPATATRPPMCTTGMSVCGTARSRCVWPVSARDAHTEPN